MSDRITRVLCLVFPMLAGGCAVATIDVDVYKGPLTNHRDVQTEQLAAMASGARPLLTELRNRLQWPSGSAETGGSFRDVPGYRDDYMPEPGEKPVFTVSRASRVNEILSLYADRTDPRLTALLNEGRSALEQYRHAYEVLRESGVSEKVVWEDLRGAMRQGLDKPIAVPNGINDLWDGYDKLSQRTGPYDPKAQYEQWIIKGHVLLVSKAATDPTLKLLASWNLDDKLLPANGTAKGVAEEPKDVDPSQAEMIIPANAAFELLANRQFVAAHAGVLFPEDQQRAKQTFVTYVTAVGQSFIDAREAMARMGHVTLELITYANTAGGPGTVRKEEITRNLADNVMKYYSAQHLFEVLLAAGASDVAAPDAVTELGRVLRKGHENTFANYTAAQTKLNAPRVGKQPADELEAGKLMGDSERELVAIVKDQLEHNPLITVDRLLRADQYYREVKVASAQSDSFVLYDQPASARKYGLARGPTEAQPADVTKGWQASTEILGLAGLGNGRLDSGLNSLIETYLKVSFEGALDMQNRSVLRERERLLTGLAQFAEKILFMANNQALLGGNDDSTEIGQTTQKYALLLQSVGNSILVQVDELRKAATYDRDAASAGPREAEALREAFYDDPATAIDRMIEDLRDESNRIRQTNKDRAGKIDNAVTMILLHRANLNESFSASPPATARAARGRLRALLDAGVKPAAPVKVVTLASQAPDPTPNDEKVKLLDAVAIVGEYETTLLVRPSVGEGGDSRTVLDQLIKALQYERIKATTEGGTDSVRAARLKNAIDLAYTYRSGMIYLRPASSFLKNSYPATSLQPDAKLAWENTLETHAWRSGTPLIPNLYEQHKESNLTAAEIDKQFWQNVNTVRVAGGGDTNYVIAKDDIGNWYVKAYANNMKDIIESTGALTTFAMSPAAAAMMSKSVTNLATKAGNAASKSTPAKPNVPGQAATPAPTADPSPQPSAADLQLSSEAKKYDDAYKTASAADYKAIAGFALAQAANANSANAPKTDPGGAPAAGPGTAAPVKAAAATLGAAAPTNSAPAADVPKTPATVPTAGAPAAGAPTTAPSPSDPPLKKAILGAWKMHIKQSDVPILENEFDNAYMTYVQGAVDSELDAKKDPGPQFTKALGALRDFNNGLKLQLAQVSNLGDESTRAIAIRDLTSVMQVHLVPLIDGRKKTVDDYTTQLRVLNDLSAP